MSCKRIISRLMPASLAVVWSTSAIADDYILIAQSDSGCTLYIDGTDLVSVGCNVHIRNGEDYTEIDNGLGNLMVGYDEADSDDAKTGSHNLVVGPRHSYDSVGGLVAGHDNEILSTFCALLGIDASDAERERIAQLSSMPFGQGGVGLRSASRTLSSAYWASNALPPGAV